MWTIDTHVVNRYPSGTKSLEKLVLDDLPVVHQHLLIATLVDSATKMCHLADAPTHHAEMWLIDGKNSQSKNR